MELMPGEAVAVVREAQDWLLRYGWKQGPNYREGGSGCLSVAFAQTGRTLPEQCAGWTLLRAVVGDDIVSWNDVQGRTWEEVRAALDNAIALGSHPLTTP